MLRVPMPQQLCGTSAEVSIHRLGATLGSEMEHIFPDAPHGQCFLAAITFQFPLDGIDLAVDSGAGYTAQVHQPTSDDLALALSEDTFGLFAD